MTIVNTSAFPLFPSLPTTTIIPTDDDLWVPYFNRLYEDIASAVNFKDNNFYQMAISSTATNIVNVPTFGAFIICVSGEDSTLPTITASLCKADAGSAGSVATLGSQVGTGAWAGFALTISSTSTNFQIAHNNTGVTGNFNLRVIGTQYNNG
jgi:hypothetical protein